MALRRRPSRPHLTRAETRSPLIPVHGGGLSPAGTESSGRRVYLSVRDRRGGRRATPIGLNQLGDQGPRATVVRAKGCNAQRGANAAAAYRGRRRARTNLPPTPPETSRTPRVRTPPTRSSRHRLGSLGIGLSAFRMSQSGNRLTRRRHMGAAAETWAPTSSPDAVRRERPATRERPKTRERGVPRGVFGRLIGGRGPS